MLIESIDTIKIKQALRFMGHKGNDIPENMKEIIIKCEKQLLDVIKPAYTYRCFNIHIQDDGVHLENTSFILRGNDIKKHLLKCSKAVLMCATLGIESEKLIHKLSVSNMSESFITDALASAAIEEVCDRIEDKIKNNLENMFMTWRFSPGYGDFPLEQQEDFLKVTDAEKRIGLYLSEGGMMIPSKSVTAVIGLSEEKLEQNKQSCCCCNMSDRCNFKKRGEHCGF